MSDDCAKSATECCTEEGHQEECCAQKKYKCARALQDGEKVVLSVKMKHGKVVCSCRCKGGAASECCGEEKEEGEGEHEECCCKKDTKCCDGVCAQKKYKCCKGLKEGDKVSLCAKMKNGKVVCSCKCKGDGSGCCGEEKKQCGYCPRKCCGASPCARPPIPCGVPCSCCCCIPPQCFCRLLMHQQMHQQQPPCPCLCAMQQCCRMMAGQTPAFCRMPPQCGFPPMGPMMPRMW